MSKPVKLAAVLATMAVASAAPPTFQEKYALNLIDNLEGMSEIEKANAALNAVEYVAELASDPMALKRAQTTAQHKMARMRKDFERLPPEQKADVAKDALDAVTEASAVIYGTVSQAAAAYPGLATAARPPVTGNRKLQQRTADVIAEKASSARAAAEGMTQAEKATAALNAAELFAELANDPIARQKAQANAQKAQAHVQNQVDKMKKDYEKMSPEEKVNAMESGIKSATAVYDAVAQAAATYAGSNGNRRNLQEFERPPNIPELAPGMTREQKVNFATTVLKAAQFVSSNPNAAERAKVQAKRHYENMSPAEKAALAQKGFKIASSVAGQVNEAATAYVGAYVEANGANRRLESNTADLVAFGMEHPRLAKTFGKRAVKKAVKRPKKAVKKAKKDIQKNGLSMAQATAVVSGIAAAAPKAKEAMSNAKPAAAEALKSAQASPALEAVKNVVSGKIEAGGRRLRS